MDPDLTRPNAARVYDYLLGGHHNFATDRELGEQLARQLPQVPAMFVANRAFLGRAVGFCARLGYDQFLDLGSGIPTAGNVHEVARAVRPGARVAYVDNEPVAVQHSAAILAEIDGVTITDADLRDVDAVLAAPTVREVLDLSRPVALLAVAVLHFLPDTADVAALLGRYRRGLAPGSALVVSHASADHERSDLRETVRAIQALYQGSAHPAHLRDREELARVLDGWDVQPPGLVDIAQWRPDTADPHPTVAYGAVAVSPQDGDRPVRTPAP